MNTKIKWMKRSVKANGLLLLSLSGAAYADIPPAPTDGLLKAQIQMTRERAQSLKSDLERGMKSTTFTNADYLENLRKINEALDQALPIYETELVEKVLKPASERIALYQSVDQAPQYSREEAKTLKQRLYSSQLEPLLTDQLPQEFKKVFGKLVESVRVAAELSTMTAANIRDRSIFGCVSQSCVLLMRTSFPRVLGGLAGLSNVLNFTVDGKSFGEYYTRVARAEVDGWQTFIHSEKIPDTFPFDVKSDDYLAERRKNEFDFAERMSKADAIYRGVLEEAEQFIAQNKISLEYDESVSCEWEKHLLGHRLKGVSAAKVELVVGCPSPMHFVPMREKVGRENPYGWLYVRSSGVEANFGMKFDLEIKERLLATGNPLWFTCLNWFRDKRSWGMEVGPNSRSVLKAEPIEPNESHRKKCRRERR